MRELMGDFGGEDHHKALYNVYFYCYYKVATYFVARRKK